MPGPPAPAYEPRTVPRYEFLENSYIFYDLPNVGPPGESPLMIEAQVAPHLFFWNDLQKVERFADTSRFLQAISFTFMLRLRMVTDVSNPVRPPSFMPRLDYQGFWFWKKEEEAGTPLRHKQVEMLEVRASIGHHSNGQQYCPFAAGVLAGQCQGIDVSSPPVDQLNFKTGDFSTNYIIGAVHYARLSLDENFRERSRWWGGVVLEANPLYMGPGGINMQTTALYGLYRGKLEGGVGHHYAALFGLGSWSGTAALSASLEWMPGTPSPIPSYRAIAEASYVFDRLHGFGLFARFVSGQDYMNVLFARPAINTAQVGLIWDVSPQLQYEWSPGETSPQGG